MENTPEDPDPLDEGVFGDWVDSRHPKEYNFVHTKAALYAILVRCHLSTDFVANRNHFDSKLLEISGSLIGFAVANQGMIYKAHFLNLKNL